MDEDAEQAERDPGAYAFGDPDGSRVNTLDLVSPRSGERTSSILDFSGGDRRARIVVGRKGAGKTVFLRKIRESVQSEASSAVIAREEPTTQLLKTAEVLKVAQWYPEELLTEVWMQVWRSAVLTSVATMTINDRRISGARKAEVVQILREIFGNKVPLRQRGIFSAVRLIIADPKSGHELSSLLDRFEWDDLEEALTVAIQRLPPIYLFIDTIDEELRSAPMYWLRCQKGLFYQVTRFLRSEIGGRLHIFIAIRDLVLSSVYRSEHAPRYHSDRHIVLLDWSEFSARQLIAHKLGRMSEDFWQGRDEPPLTFSDWIGHATIENRLGGNEKVDDYILRHTHMLPRDVMIIGNEIGLRRREGGDVDSKLLQRLVSTVAHRMATSNINVAANQLLSDLIPVGAADMDFSEFYTSSKEYSDWASEQVAEVIRMAPGLWIGRSDIRQMDELARQIFDEGSSLTSVLWQNGLLGYVEGSRHRFYSLSGVDTFSLPDAKSYVFHPTVREVSGLEPGTMPIVPDFSA